MLKWKITTTTKNRKITITSFYYIKNISKHTMQIRVIIKLPNFEQSSKGKGKTHKYTNRQNQSTTGKLGKP